MKNYILFVLLLVVIVFGINTAQAQDTLGQQAYAILENKCLNCHGTGGSFTEQLLITDRDQLIGTGSVVPNDPDTSELYLRLISTDTAKRMPLGQPALSLQAIATIRKWITQGAPDWTVEQDIDFIMTGIMLDTIQSHLDSLQPYERPYARYFSLTHLYNVGETGDNLQAYRNALSKLVNSLSWGHDIIKPHPINPSETLFYIDLRHYEWDEWDTRDDVWKRIEQVYPYTFEFNPETEADQFEKLTQLQQDTESTVPFIHVDWFLATASLPPLYHDILRLPDTDLALEEQLGIDVQRNIQQSPGIRVARAGIVDSGVSKNNRVVERHTSVYGAYWKSYDFAGSVGAQNIRTHPLSFKHDGGEIVFNLPNGLQAYYISDDKGNRIDKAPTDIVSNPAASDPAVRNGLSCIGCHTQGMKTFEDVMRTTIELTENPTYDKTQALRLYVGQDRMDKYLEQDTEKYRLALVQATGHGFEDIEPVHRAHEVFEQPLDAADAAAALGLKTEALVQQIQDKQSLQNLGLTALLGGGTINRDAWTAQFADIISAINSDDSTIDPTPTPDRDIPIGNVAYIPDPNLLTAIAKTLGKPNASTITITEMETLTILIADDAGIRDLTGLEKATKLQRIELRRNAIIDLTPLAGLIRLNNIKLRGNNITDVSPLANLKSLDWLGLEETNITDLSSLTGLVRLRGIGIDDTPVTDLTPLAKLPSLEGVSAWDTRISDFSVLASARRLKWIQCRSNRELTNLDSLRQLKTLRRLEINNAGITNIDALSELTQLDTLVLADNQISDLSPLHNLKNLKVLYLHYNLISDLTPLAELTQLKQLKLEHNIISDASPLVNLTNLTILDLRENAIADFSPLESLPQSVSISSEGNVVPFIKTDGTKIEGPWLWMIAPTDGLDPINAVRSETDFLAQISNGSVTEDEIATEGAINGSPVGTKVWTPAKISPINGNNINDLVNTTGLGSGDVDYHVAYGSIRLHSSKQQQTTMLVGSDDSVKVWINGTLVHTNAVFRGASDYQDSFAVTLKEGINVLLVAVYEGGGGWSGFFGFETGTQYTVLPPADRFTLDTDTKQLNVGETFTLHLNAAEVDDLAGWQSDIAFDPAVLKALNITEGSFLKQNQGRTYFQKGSINNETGRITGISSTRTTEGGVEGQGRLLSITFETVAVGESRVSLRNFHAGKSTGESISTTITQTQINISIGNPSVDEDTIGFTLDIDTTKIATDNTFTLILNANNIINLAGWSADITFDKNKLEATQVNEGEFLKSNGGNTLFLNGTTDNSTGEIRGISTLRRSKGGVSGTGHLLTITFKVKVNGTTTITFNNFKAGTSNGNQIPAAPLNISINVGENYITTTTSGNYTGVNREDVNQDGSVDIVDILIVVGYLGRDATIYPTADINGDNTIDILDLILLTQYIETTEPSAPVTIATNSKALTPEMVKSLIKQAQAQDDGSLIFRTGIANLHKLLDRITPKKSALLPNYPNPFNPETWIPYQLAKPADVSISIYTADGKVVRTLALGNMPAGIYTSQSRAAYWDGKNALGEPVASGVYFYVLTAGDFTATRKMLIMK